MNSIRAAAWLASLFLVACAAGDKGDKGDTGDKGERGHSCSVKDTADGARLIACEDGTEVVVADGAAGTNGKDGANCTVADNPNGTKTLSCEDGTQVVVRDGAKGEDAACAGNSAPVFESAKLENPYGVPVQQGRSFPVRLAVSDPDGDRLTIDFAGVGATFEPTDDPAVFTFTPHMTGGPFLYTVSVSDGCRLVAGSFSVRRVSAKPSVLLAITRGEPSAVWAVDPLAGQSHKLGDLELGRVTGVAVNPVDGKVYVHNHNSNDSSTEGLYELNLSDRSLRYVGATGLWLPDMAFSPDGTLYAFDSNTTLVTIDLETAVATEVAETPYFGVIGIAFRGEELYLKDYESLYRLDKDTGEVLWQTRYSTSQTLDNALEYDPWGDRFFAVDEQSFNQTDLFSIDPDTGEASRLAVLPFDKVSAIALFDDVWAPQPVQNLTATAGTDTARLTFEFVASDLDADVESAYLTWSPNGPAKPIRASAWDLVDEDGDRDETVPARWFATGLSPATTYTFSIRLMDRAGNLSDETSTTATTVPAPPRVEEAMYGVEEDGGLYIVDPATGALTEVGDTGLSRVSAFAINPLDGKAYLTSNDTKKLYEVDLETAEVTEIGATGLDNVRDIAFSPEGGLVGWNRDSDLVSFDLATGATTVILSVGGEWPTGIAWFGGAPHVKIRNRLARWAVGGEFTEEPEFMVEIIGDIDFHLGHSLTFSQSGAAYSIQHDWNNGRTSLFRIDGDSWVATRVTNFADNIRLTSVDFLKPAAR